MALSAGLAILVALFLVLGLLTVANAIVLSIAHADLNKNKAVITPGSTLAAAQHALFVDLIISWCVVGFYFLIALAVGGLIFLAVSTGAAEVAGAAAFEATVANGGLPGGKKTALGGLVVGVGLLLLLFGVIVGFEGYYAAQAARNIIKSTSFTETGSLSTSYWLTFWSAALGLGSLFLVVVTLASIVSTWVIEKRASKIFARLAKETEALVAEARETAARGYRQGQKLAGQAANQAAAAGTAAAQKAKAAASAAARKAGEASAALARAKDSLAASFADGAGKAVSPAASDATLSAATAAAEKAAAEAQSAAVVAQVANAPPVPTNEPGVA